MELTQEYIKTQVHYDPDTGIFTRNGKRAGTVMADGYRMLGLGGTIEREHKLAFLYMTGELPPNQVDHINGAPGDNRWDNLRLCTHQQNMQNKRLYKTSTTGIGGVRWRPEVSKWRVLMSVGGKRINIGHYTTIFDAAAARISAQNRLGYSDRHGRT